MFMNMEGYEAAASNLIRLQFKLGDKAPKMIWTYFSEGKWRRGGAEVREVWTRDPPMVRFSYNPRSFRRFNDCFRS